MPNPMMQHQSTYLIIREDRLDDQKEVVAEGLRIGSDSGCELGLNHPKVSGLHAGVREIEGRFFITDFDPSNSITLNGRLIKYQEPEEIFDGDELHVGPFFLGFNRTTEGLRINVSQQPGFGLADARAREPADSIPVDPPAAQQPRPAPPEAAQALELFWGNRTQRQRSDEQSPLHPQQAARPGKAQFYWRPTSDLVRSWPNSIFVWSAIALGLSLFALTRLYPSAFSPNDVARAHARTMLTPEAAIASRPNANACTLCHARGASVEQNCASCHEAENFVATVTPPHAQHGVGCATCHPEHRGADFNPREAALKMCAECHDDHTIYNNRQMKTPHPETGFGYPVVNGEWRWRGLDAEAWENRPIKLKEQFKRLSNSSERQKRIMQFHALHLYRVRSVAGLAGNAAGEISCSSCHNSYGGRMDTATPRTKCARCHNGKIDEQTNRILIADDRPNCASCHVQHALDKRHWNKSLLSFDLRQAAGSNSRSQAQGAQAATAGLPFAAQFEESIIKRSQ
jgi:pSer/pThr/pTyr-binding forkhead associated (FHA) protein